MILSKFRNFLKFQKAPITYISRCPFSETDDSFYKQSFFTKSYTKPFTVTTDDTILSMNCVKGRFKQQQSYITLDKVGAIILDFIPIIKTANDNQKQQLDVRGKKNFTLGIKQVGELLKYDPHDLRNTVINLEFKYYAGSQYEHKKLSIQKNAQEELVSFNLSVTKQGNSSTFNTPVDLGDFIIMQELCRYSLPYVLGWHIMNSPRIAEEEFNSTTPNSFENYN